MDEISATFAKIAGLYKSFQQIPWGGNGRTNKNYVGHLFVLYESLTEKIQSLLPEIYSDLPKIAIPKSIGSGGSPLVPIYDKVQIDPLINNLGYILEVHSNSRIAEKKSEASKKEVIFISHGRNTEWYKVQAYLERDLSYRTLELAQEPNLGRTILQKLDEESNKCRVAIIVMTGDDATDQGEVRARENVLHEIGFFQGKLGLNNIVLLHEEGVNIPTNIHGLVYIPFAKGVVDSTFGGLTRELKVLMA